jgi:hypothetical protein
MRWQIEKAGTLNIAGAAVLGSSGTDCTIDSFYPNAKPSLNRRQNLAKNVVGNCHSGDRLSLFDLIDLDNIHKSVCVGADAEPGGTINALAGLKLKNNARTDEF